jgi:hypothetical protein
MKKLQSSLAILFLITIGFLRCSNNTHQSKQKEKTQTLTGILDTGIKRLSLYLETPKFIRNYLDSIEGKKHWIANPGENWNGGCVQLPGLPSSQFVCANLSSNRYVMTLRGGGIAPATKFIVIHFTNESILDYSIKGNYPLLEN